jgi:hypothetical protein
MPASRRTTVHLMDEAVCAGPLSECYQQGHLVCVASRIYTCKYGGGGHICTLDDPLSAHPAVHVDCGEIACAVSGLVLSSRRTTTAGVERTAASATVTVCRVVNDASVLASSSTTLLAGMPVQCGRAISRLRETGRAQRATDRERVRGVVHALAAGCEVLYDRQCRVLGSSELLSRVYSADRAYMARCRTQRRPGNSVGRFLFCTAAARKYVDGVVGYGVKPSDYSSRTIESAITALITIATFIREGLDGVSVNATQVALCAVYHAATGIVEDGVVILPRLPALVRLWVGRAAVKDVPCMPVSATINKTQIALCRVRKSVARVFL